MIISSQSINPPHSSHSQYRPPNYPIYTTFFRFLSSIYTQSVFCWCLIGTWLQGIKMEWPRLCYHKSAQLQRFKDINTEPKHPLPSPIGRFMVEWRQKWCRSHWRFSDDMKRRNMGMNVDLYMNMNLDIYKNPLKVGLRQGFTSH
jgi:hypothetical protein